MFVAGETGSIVKPRIIPLSRAVLTSVGLGLLAFCWMAFPALFDGRNALDDIVHGSAIPAGIGLTVVMLTLFLLFRGIDRRTQQGRSPVPLFIGTFCGLFVLGVLALLLTFGGDYRLAVDLKDHGVPVQARLVRQFADSCSKHGCITEIEYSFVPKGRTAQIRGFANEGNTGQHAYPEYRDIVATGMVPVVYDPGDPSRSMVNWSGQVRRLASPRFFIGEVGIFAGFLLFGIGVLAGVLWPVMRALSAWRAAKQDPD